MQVPILSGIYGDTRPDWRTAYPRNMVPVPVKTGLSNGYLRPAPGLVPHADFSVVTGPFRGGVFYKDQLFWILPQVIYAVDRTGLTVGAASLPGSSRCRIVQGSDRLAIATNDRLYYWTGVSSDPVVDANAADPDFGTVIDVAYLNSHYVVTDGQRLITTDIDNPLSVNPLKYQLAAADPDVINSLDLLGLQLAVIGRYSIEFRTYDANLEIQDKFPFSPVLGATVNRGSTGLWAACRYRNGIAFVGGGRDENTSVHWTAGGQSQRIANREIDLILGQYLEGELKGLVIEHYADNSHDNLLIHLPDQTLVFDGRASEVVGQPVWHTRDSGNDSERQAYRAKYFVRAYDRWFFEDLQSMKIGYLDDSVSTHFGAVVPWEFQTDLIYNEARSAIVHEIELVGLPGSAAVGDTPTVWSSYSEDGAAWSGEIPLQVSTNGARLQRMRWIEQGLMEQKRTIRFRGDSSSQLLVNRLEATVEGLAL